MNEFLKKIDKEMIVVVFGRKMFFLLLILLSMIVVVHYSEIVNQIQNIIAVPSDDDGHFD